MKERKLWRKAIGDWSWKQGSWKDSPPLGGCPSMTTSFNKAALSIMLEGLSVSEPQYHPALETQERWWAWSRAQGPGWHLRHHWPPKQRWRHGASGSWNSIANGGSEHRPEPYRPVANSAFRYLLLNLGYKFPIYKYSFYFIGSWGLIKVVYGEHQHSAWHIINA